MVVTPELNPVTTCVDMFIVATPILLMLHIPPAVASDKVIVDGIQIVEAPDIKAGDASTVTGNVTDDEHDVYVMITLPELTPVITPAALTVARLLLDDHTPPITDSDNVADTPAHMVDGPLIAAGVVVTVTEIVVVSLTHVLDTMYEIIAEPEDTPATIPPALMLAIPVLLVTQIPPEVPDVVNVAMLPVHKLDGTPEILPASMPEQVT